jgi:hypothetical protein
MIKRISYVSRFPYWSSLVRTWHIKHNIVALVFYYTATDFSRNPTFQVIHIFHVLFYEIFVQNIFQLKFKARGPGQVFRFASP